MHNLASIYCWRYELTVRGLISGIQKWEEVVSVFSKLDVPGKWES